MITVLTLCKDNNEKDILRGVYRDLAAGLTEEKWELVFCVDPGQCRTEVAKEPVLDFICVDVCDKESLAFLPELRKRYPDAGLALLADLTVSPVLYLKPGIRPDTILIKPFVKENLTDTLEEFFMDRLSYREAEGDNNSFLVETREGKTFIPYSQIFYFEAREKKVFLRTLYKEYGFYSTIEELAKGLPDYFLRSHRSFIVNRNTVENMKGNEVFLRQGFTIPLSRSYKSDFVEKMKG